MVKQRRWIGELELQHLAGQTLLSLGQHRLAANEVAEPAGWLFGLDGETKAGFQNMILVGDVMAEMPEGFFDPA